jgi:hypothetical protein
LIGTMATKSNSPEPGDDPAVHVPQGPRTLISLLLFVHMFGLGLVFFSNFEGGDWDSLLLDRMKVAVRPYLYPLWLDRPYHYHLSYGHELDFDHYIDVALVAPGSSDETVVRLPDDSLAIGPRRERYERLAWHFARRAALATPDELLPLAIGAGVLKQNDAKRAQVRVYRKVPLYLDDVLAGAERNTPDERIYAADVFFLPGYEQPQLNKLGEARDVAPVTKPSAGGGQGPAPPSRQKDAATGTTERAQPGAQPLRNPLSPATDSLRPPALPPPLPPDNK